MKIRTRSIHTTFIITLLFGCTAFLPRMQAVIPAPDGGYPGGNTAEGDTALLSLTTGGFNTAVGLFSLRSLSSGSFNTAIGAGTLLANTGDENTATGAAALLGNTTGTLNTADGALAMFNNTTGNSNIAIGFHALFGNTAGDSNTAVGVEALFNSATAAGNTAVGQGALFACTGAQNTAIGAGAGFSVHTATNVICIGANVPGADVTGSCFIGHIHGVTTQHANAIPVLVDSAGQLGTISSSRQFKREIKPMDQASQAILALKPVTFHYKSDKTNTPQFGLIAEEVADIDPDLVVRDESGAIYTVRYDAVNAILLNEFLKEHQKNDEQQATITQLKNEMASLTATVKDQAAQIQRVSAQIEVTRPTSQVAINKP